MKVLLLGAGLVGAPMAIDLSQDEMFEVTVADYSEDALNNLKSRCPELSVVQRDLSNPESVTALVRDYDLVVNAVPGFMGFETAKAIIKERRQLGDIRRSAPFPRVSDGLKQLLLKSGLQAPHKPERKRAAIPPQRAVFIIQHSFRIQGVRP